jgi:predicted ATPase
LITLDPVTASWTWDIQRIEAQGFTANVVELMVARLARLPDGTQDALRHAACLGSQFVLHTLATAREWPDKKVEEALRTALRERQLHDRVQQAAYVLTPESERPGLHLRIGRLLLAGSRPQPQQQEEALFLIVNQLNRGVALIADGAEKEALCSLNFRAGRKARASIAYASA